MSDVVIRAERLGKKYIIGHETQRESYTALRDVIARGAQNLLRKARDMVHGRPIIEGDELEEVWALRDVGFEITRGEVVGIIGRNGAGKSTLLKILCRITDPSEGRASIRGRVASLLEVGTGFHPELTGRENIFLNGAILGMARAEIRRKFEDIVAFAEVEKFIDTPVKRYSSGMYVRLAFAVAAHLDPEILIVDEVLAVGDVEFQKKCLGKMGEIGKEGRTVLLVSHNMPTILNLCHRAVLLTAGKITKEGLPDDVVQHYLGTARSADGEVLWPEPANAPGSDIVRLHAVRILQEGMYGPGADVDISKEVQIQLEYWNLRENELIYSAIWLKDRMGTVVLSSGNHASVSLTHDAWCGRPHPVGLYKSVCRIPGNFLNDGMYSVTAIVGKGITDTQLLEENVLSFHVYDTGTMRKEYQGGWIGVIRPRLAWETEQVKAGI